MVIIGKQEEKKSSQAKQVCQLTKMEKRETMRKNCENNKNGRPLNAAAASYLERHERWTRGGHAFLFFFFFTKLFCVAHVCHCEPIPLSNGVSPARRRLTNIINATLDLSFCTRQGWNLHKCAHDLFSLVKGKWKARPESIMKLSLWI